MKRGFTGNRGGGADRKGINRASCRHCNCAYICTYSFQQGINLRIVSMNRLFFWVWMDSPISYSVTLLFLGMQPRKVCAPPEGRKTKQKSFFFYVFTVIVIIILRSRGLFSFPSLLAPIFLQLATNYVTTITILPNAHSLHFIHCQLSRRRMILLALTLERTIKPPSG